MNVRHISGGYFVVYQVCFRAICVPYLTMFRRDRGTVLLTHTSYSLNIHQDTAMPIEPLYVQQHRERIGVLVLEPDVDHAGRCSFLYGVLNEVELYIYMQRLVILILNELFPNFKFSFISIHAIGAVLLLQIGMDEALHLTKQQHLFNNLREGGVLRILCGNSRRLRCPRKNTSW